MKRSIHTCVAATLFALMTIGCVTEPDPAARSHGLPTIEASPYGRASGPSAVIGDELLAPASVCECQTQQCVVDLIRDQFGCDLCMQFRCDGDRRVGACVPCH